MFETTMPPLQDPQDETARPNFANVEKGIRDEVLIKSEVEYCQPTDRQLCTLNTRDVGTQPCVDTDNVYITCELYSMTDLPSCLEPSAQTDPKPGMIIPEYFDGQCAILRAYRSKGVNTKDTVDNSKVDPLSADTAPTFEVTEVTDTSITQVKEEFRSVNTHALRLTAKIALESESYSPIGYNSATCKKSCPNLLISVGVQTTDFEEKPLKLEDQGDKKDDSSPTVCITPGTLTIIEEQDEEREMYKEIRTDNAERVRTDPEKKVTRKPGGTADIAVGGPDMVSVGTGIQRRFRKPTTNIFETGTLLETHSAAWLDRPKRGKECRVICTRPSGSFYFDSRVQDNLNYCPRIGQSSDSRCFFQCDDARNSFSTNCSDRSFNCPNRPYRMESCCATDSNELCPMTDNWTSKNRQSIASLQETCMQHQLYRVNGFRGCSIISAVHCPGNRLNPGNVCNNHLARRYCVCTNGYNAMSGNMCYSSVGSWTGYRAGPSYYYSCNAWS